jgi:phage terminase large subunit
MQINLPYNFKYREYQKPQFIAAQKGIKRFYKVWHRRAGKDLTDFNFMVMKAMERKGSYWHLLPEYNQARKAIWQGMTKEGTRFIDFIPPVLIKSTNNQEMKVELINGSIIQILGSDRIDSLVGSNPVGVNLSEFALTNPRAWGLIEPILLENDGWAVFNTTPRGKNHAYDLWVLAQNNPKWFTQFLTIKDTNVIPEEFINELRSMGTDEETIQQEYYCSFEGAMQGAYYAEQIKYLEDNNKIIDFPYLQEYPVTTYWDIGRRDYTVIWFMQKVGYEYRLIDYYYESGGDVDIFARELVQRGYRYEKHMLPHDAGHLRVGMLGKTIQQQLQDALPKENIRVLKRTGDVQGDIIATRSFLRRCAFNKTACKDGVNALKNYTKKWNDQRNAWSDEPFHNWASHGADAFRELAMNCIADDNLSRPLIDNNGLPTFNHLLNQARNTNNKRFI